MYNTRREEIENLGFKLYYNELATAVDIRDEITPPDGASEIFVGCGRTDGGTVTRFDAGIIVEPAELFNPKAYAHSSVQYATEIRNFHTYDDSNHDTYYSRPMGFTRYPEIWLQAIDIFDCDESSNEKLNCPSDKLDFSRVSFHTVNNPRRDYSMWRCGVHTYKNTNNFTGLFRLIFYYH